MRKAIETFQSSPKVLFENRFDQLPEDIKADLRTKKAKVVDHEYFAMVKANGNGDIEMFSKSLDEGLATNMHQGLMPSDTYFLITSIVLASAVGTADSTIENACALDFSGGIGHPVLANAKFKLKVGQDVFMEDCATSVFQKNNTNLEKGEFKLSNPMFLRAKEYVEFDIEDIAAALPAETWVKLRFKGLKTSKK